MGNAPPAETVPCSDESYGIVAYCALLMRTSAKICSQHVLRTGQGGGRVVMDVPASCACPNLIFCVKNSLHSPIFAYCALEPLQNSCAVLQMLSASNTVSFPTVSAKFLVWSWTATLPRMYSIAHGHHLKIASYCEISLAELKVSQVSIVIGTGRLKLVVLKIILLELFSRFHTISK